MRTKIIKFDIEKKDVKYFIDILSEHVVTGKLSVQKYCAYAVNNGNVEESEKYYFIIGCKMNNFDKILNILMESATKGLIVQKLETH